MELLIDSIAIVVIWAVMGLTVGIIYARKWEHDAGTKDKPGIRGEE